MAVKPAPAPTDVKPTDEAPAPESTEPTLPEQEVQFLTYLDAEISALEERENRLTHLRSIKAAMTGQVITPAKASTNGASKPRTGERKKDRLAEFVGLVTEKPGITISEAAKAMECAPNYLYRLKTRGISENLIRVEGSNVFPGEEVQAAA